MLNEKSYHCITLIVIFRDILVWGLYGNPAFLKSYTFIYVYLYICIYIYIYIKWFGILYLSPPQELGMVG